MILIVMGVSGCGKTTVGKALAESLSCEFYDGDDFHPEENKKRMSAGVGLTDADRSPWLEALRKEIQRWVKSKADTVLACSALKRSYRTLLISRSPEEEAITGEETSSIPSLHEESTLSTQPIVFVHLKGSFQFISERISKRKDHFMPTMLLQSQFEDLEEPTYPENHVHVDIDGSVNETVSRIVEKLDSL